MVDNATDFVEQAQHYTSVDANNPTNSSFIFDPDHKHTWSEESKD